MMFSCGQRVNMMYYYSVLNVSEFHSVLFSNSWLWLQEGQIYGNGAFDNGLVEQLFLQTSSLYTPNSQRYSSDIQQVQSTDSRGVCNEPCSDDYINLSSLP